MNLQTALTAVALGMSLAVCPLAHTQEPTSETPAIQNVLILDHTRSSWTPEVAVLVQSMWPHFHFRRTDTPILPSPSTMLVRIVRGRPASPHSVEPLGGVAIPQIRLALIYPDALPRHGVMPGQGQRQFVPTPLPRLLAHLIAHEIGHLLGYSHSPTGLMKADLSSTDLLHPPLEAINVK